MLMLVVDVVLVIHRQAGNIWRTSTRQSVGAPAGLLAIQKHDRYDPLYELRMKEKSVSNCTGDMLYGDIIDMYGKGQPSEIK